MSSRSTTSLALHNLNSQEHHSIIKHELSSNSNNAYHTHPPDNLDHHGLSHGKTTNQSEASTPAAMAPIHQTFTHHPSHDIRSMQVNSTNNNNKLYSRYHRISSNISMKDDRYHSRIVITPRHSLNHSSKDSRLRRRHRGLLVEAEEAGLRVMGGGRVVGIVDGGMIPWSGRRS